MKTLVIVFFICCSSHFALSQTVKKTVTTNKDAVAKTLPKKKIVTMKSEENSKEKAPETRINKTPKAIFLIKRAKMDADIGEPVLYPFERQLGNLYYDLPGGVIRND